MTTFQRRIVIMIDEWLGWTALLYLYEHKAPPFWPCLVFFLVTVYGISYPVFWWKHDRWWRNE